MSERMWHFVMLRPSRNIYDLERKWELFWGVICSGFYDLVLYSLLFSSRSLKSQQIAVKNP